MTVLVLMSVLLLLFTVVEFAPVFCETLFELVCVDDDKKDDAVIVGVAGVVVVVPCRARLEFALL